MSEAQERLNSIVNSLREGGYDPYAQILGYIKTGDDTLITRRNSARELIKLMNKEDLVHFVTENAPSMKR